MKLSKIAIVLLVALLAAVGLTNGNFNEDPYLVALRMFDAMDDVLHASAKLQTLLNCAQDPQAEDQQTEDVHAGLERLRNIFFEDFANF